MLGEYIGVGPLGVSVIREFVQYNPDNEGREMRLLAKTCGYDTESDNAVDMSASCYPFQATETDNKQRYSKDIYDK